MESLLEGGGLFLQMKAQPTNTISFLPLRPPFCPHHAHLVPIWFVTNGTDQIGLVAHSLLTIACLSLISYAAVETNKNTSEIAL